MHAERIDDLHCHWLIGRFEECTGDDILQLLACSNNAADGRVALEKTIGLDSGPVVVKGDNARCILRHTCIEDALDGGRDILQDMAVLNQVQLVENINVRRMNRE